MILQNMGNSVIPLVMHLKTALLFEISKFRQTRAEFYGVEREIDQEGIKLKCKEVKMKSKRLADKVEVMKERLETIIKIELELDLTTSPKISALTPDKQINMVEFDLDKQLIEGDLDVDTYASKLAQLAESELSFETQ